MVPVKNSNYDGFFMSLADTQLPEVWHTSWCNGAGMYPTDLLVDNYQHREVWATLHSSVRPTVDLGNAHPAIGVFLHRGQEYEILVNGVDKKVQV